jgi:hypothetical protein
MKQLNVLPKRVSQSVSNVFFEIGNSINLANLLPLNYKKPIKSDLMALKDDWDNAGREVLLAFGEFEKEYFRQK